MKTNAVISRIQKVEMFRKKGGIYLYVIPRRPHSDYKGEIRWQVCAIVKSLKTGDVFHVDELLGTMLFSNEEDAWKQGIEFFEKLMITENIYNNSPYIADAWEREYRPDGKDYSVNNSALGGPCKTQQSDMEKYIGTKELLAKPMTLGQYNEYRGWDMPMNEDPTSPGYLVEYVDGGKGNDVRHEGYISWSPKEVFELAYRPIDKLDFGKALHALKEGAIVARKGWNGKGMYIFLRPEFVCTRNTLNNITSIPQGVKDREVIAYHAHTAEEAKNGLSPEETTISFGAYICMRAADGNIVNGWLPSQTDMLSDDWEILL